MTASTDINLLHTKTRLSPQLLAFADQLRRISIIALGVVIAIGILTGVIFLLLQNQRQQIASEKDQLLRTVTANAKKESAFISLKSRLPLVDRALASEKSWGQILDTVSTVTLPPSLLSVSVDDRNTVLLSLKATSLGDVSTWIGSLIDLTLKQRIRSPQLVSLQLAKDGNVLVSLSFIPQ